MAATADLQAYALERGLRLTRQGVQRLRRRGDDAARERIDAIAALVTLASALGRPLGQLAAARRLDAANGNFDTARQSFVEADRARRSGVFGREWERAERALYVRDARQRHAVFVAELDHGPLGWQAQMLMLAADDAGLGQLAASARKRIAAIVTAEVDARYPVRREDEWRVLDADGRTPHDDRIDHEIRAEQHARDLALRKAPELRQRIDRFADNPTVRRDVEHVLREIRTRLAALADEGWHPDPDRYRVDVIETAAAAAMAG